MVKKIRLNAKSRVVGKERLGDLRAGGEVPAVVYGREAEAKSLKLGAVEFSKVYDEAGESNLIDLKVDGQEEIKVIIKDVQLEQPKDRIIHVDLYQVDMKKPIEVEIPLEFVGEAKAEKELGAMILRNLEFVDVKCLPGDLVDHIDVDISPLQRRQRRGHLAGGIAGSLAVLHHNRGVCPVCLDWCMDVNQVCLAGIDCGGGGISRGICNVNL